MAAANAAETDPDGRLYLPSEDPFADVEQALVRAGEHDRLVLVVAGANWCHDSRAMAARLHRSPLADLVSEEFELVFVDVGFYELDRDVMQQLGVAHYYATPTVLIIDPATLQIVNKADHHIWADAYRIDMPTSVEYFRKWADSAVVADVGPDSPQLESLYKEIDRFEAQLAERVNAGYAVVGPMLKAYKDGNAPEEFDARWEELRNFRTAIPRDIRKLREMAEQRVSDGDSDTQLPFPEYPPLSWE